MKVIETKQNLRDLVQELGSALGVPYILLTKKGLTVPDKDERLIATLVGDNYANFEYIGFYALSKDDQLALRNILHNVTLSPSIVGLTIKVDYFEQPSDELTKPVQSRTLNSGVVLNMFTRAYKANKGSTLTYIVENEEIISYTFSIPTAYGRKVVLDYDKDRHMWVRVEYPDISGTLISFRDGYYPQTSPTVVASNVSKVIEAYLKGE